MRLRRWLVRWWYAALAALAFGACLVGTRPALRTLTQWSGVDTRPRPVLRHWRNGHDD